MLEIKSWEVLNLVNTFRYLTHLSQILTFYSAFSSQIVPHFAVQFD